ncbi:MAG: acetyl-CoA carboxylase biotin carboxyl carrier protein [Gemmataceae bacterium]|nr:acetyl-CoA carboxylase biotin carboxyl carrier protein [Gemmataceae bacterium]MDW8266867.1 acetyl-CoA carboxylase biotin carboxyl carrier protein [Gemmataceae bacterium]
MENAPASKEPNPFDPETIRKLVVLMSRHDLNEIDLRNGTMRLRLRRGMRSSGNLVAAPAATPAPAAALPAPATTAAPPPPAPEAPPPAKNLVPIKSPTPGTFYAKPSPDAEPFVRVGSRVTPNTVVCIIEAMKIFNEITADVSGVITEILVENQQPVEYGQVLFTVDPTG